MQMTYENVVYFPKPYPAVPELNLCAFTTIDQKQTLMHIKHMSGWKSF
jgi:hypothetical protein